MFFIFGWNGRKKFNGSRNLVNNYRERDNRESWIGEENIIE